MQGKSFIKLSAAVAATLTASTAFGQLFNVSIAVREVNSTAAIGESGGIGVAVTGNAIEWVNLDGLNFTADGTWQKFTFNFGIDPVTFFAGSNPPGGANNQLDGTRGTLEHIRIRNAGGTVDDVNLFIDDLENTPSGGSAVSIGGGFETQAVGAEVLVQEPRFSGSTAPFLTTQPNISRITADQAHTGVQSIETKFAFANPSATNWVRLTTNPGTGTTVTAPTIDFGPGSTLSFWLRGTTAIASQRWIGDGLGGLNWTEAGNWNEGNIPGFGVTEQANFLGDITAPRTVNADFPFVLNVIKFNSTNSYTIASSDPANNHLTLSSNSTFTPAAVEVVAGSHRIDAPVRLDLRALTLNVQDAAAVLTISSEINFNSTGLAVGTNTLNKSGPGRADVARVINPTAGINVARGTLRLAEGTTGASNVATLAIAGTAAVPTARLDVTNNGLVVNYGTTSPLADTVNRIKAGRATGDWSGNGITSSLATQLNGNGIGVAEASALNVTEFMGQTVDATAVLARYTRLGDANLTGGVDLDDFTALAAGFGIGTTWVRGDFNYDGLVNLDDFTILASNFGTSIPADAPRSAVPEPTAFAVLGLAAAGLMGRRRRA